MNIFFGQIYIEPGITFPFSHKFQKFISEEVTKNTSPSAYFKDLYGGDWNLIFRISAKQEIENLEIRGPTKFKKDCDVEYTLFLPYRKIKNSSEELTKALEIIFDGIFSVLSSLEISLSDLEVYREELVGKIIAASCACVDR